MEAFFKLLKTGACTAVILVLASCANTPAVVGYDYDESVDFTELQFYRWQDVGGTDVDPNDLDLKRIKQSVNEAMIAKGLVLLESGEPDFFISVDRSTRFTDSGSGPRVSTSVGVGGGSRGGFGGVGISIGKTLSDDVAKTMLLVDFHEATDQQLIWRGSAEYRVMSDLTPEERSERTDVIINQLLSEFPPTR
ncbi:DUF4136 domain-containing protein [Aurantivibrio plasticivorans]